MSRRCIVALAFVVGACGTAGAVDTEESVPATAMPTVPGVGSLPDTIPVPTLDENDDDEEPQVSVVVTRPVDDDGVVIESVAERVNGNRLLVIGDSILASTASRYGRELCDALNPIGWSVEVDAEPGRSVHFGNKVAKARLDVGDEDDDFDAVVIHLGSNYGRDKDEYFEQLSELLYRAAPRPTLLLTVTEYRPQWSEVNEVIRELAVLYDNVTIVDWEKIARTPGVLSRDGLHPGDQGEAVLVEQIAVALGELETGDGDCLRSSFTDDSAIRSGSGSGGSSSGGSSTRGSSSGSSSSGSSSSGGSSSGGSSGGSSSGSSGGATTGGTTSGTTGTTGGTTGGTATGGDSTGGDDTGGTDSGGTEPGGTDTGSETTGGSGTTGGSDTGSDVTGGTDSTTPGGGSTGSTSSSGSDTGGSDSTGGSTTGGSTTGGSTTGGATTGGATTGSASTGGSTTGGTDTGGTDTGSGATGGATTTGGTDTGGDGG